MNKTGFYQSFYLLLWFILLNTSCRDKTSVSVADISTDPAIQAAYDSFLSSASSVYNPSDRLIYNSFTSLKPVLDERGLLVLYSKMGDYYFKNELADSALQYFKTGLDIAINTREEYFISYFHMKCGETLTFLSEFDAALNEIKKAYLLSLELDSSTLQIKSARNLGNVYWNMGDFDLALTYYFNSLDISRRVNNTEGIAAALNNIGIIYQEIRDYERAIDYFKQSELVAEKQHYTRLLASAYNNIGDVYSKNKEYDSALVYFKKALNQEIPENSKYSNGIYLGNIADVYLKSDSLDKAKEYFLESLKNATEASDKIGIATCNLGLADVYLQEKNSEMALKYLETGTIISETLGSTYLLNYTYRLTSEYFIQKNDLSRAIPFLIKQLSVRDSVDSREKGENIARLENRYKEVQNIKEIEILKEKQKYFIILLVFGFTAFIIVFLAVFFAFRQKAKTNIWLNEKNLEIESNNRTLEEQKQKLIKSQEELSKMNKGKDVFLTIISHDLKNPLSAIRGFTELLVKNYDNLSDEKRKLFLGEIYDSIERITLLINNVLYWVKSQTDEIQMKPVKFNLSKQIEDNTSLYHLMMIKKEIKLDNMVSEKINVLADINVFDMILRNIFSNALKFTQQKGKIIINCQVIGQKVRLSVSDSGIGIAEDKLQIILSRSQLYSTIGTSHEQGTGLGLGLTRRFIDEIGGDFEIVSEQGKGTTLSFTLDLAV